MKYRIAMLTTLLSGRAVAECTGLVSPLDVSPYTATSSDYNNGFSTLYRGPYTLPTVAFVEGSGSHPGVDITHDKNLNHLTTATEILAVCDGTVVRVTHEGLGDGGWGNAVVLRHTLPRVGMVYSAYAHMDRLTKDFKLGDPIAQADVLGFAGKTGKVTGLHLHFQIDNDVPSLHPFFPNRIPGTGDGLAEVNTPDKDGNVAARTYSPLVLVQSHPKSSSIVFQPGPEGFDTVYGSLYAPGPNGDLETMYDGGWGDYYYDFFKWDLSSLPSADSVSQVVLQLYFGATVNDPAFQVLRVTSQWDESTLTRSSYPTATDWENWTGIVNTGWHSLDITELYKNWKSGVWPNYGIELAPTYNVQTNGYIISSDSQADPALRPKLVITTR